MIRITQNKGFNITFDNNLTISIQIGAGNYCSNKNNEIGKEREQRITECNNAEIAIWDENNKWFTFEGDQVKGWINANEVGIWIDKVRRAKNIKSIKRIK